MLIERSLVPVLPIDQSWEAGANLIYSITAINEPDTGLIRMYYLVRNSVKKEGLLCIARTSDGIVWEKPDLGDGTNIIMRGFGDCSWGVFLPKRIIYDEVEENPAARWKMLYWDCPGVDGSGLKGPSENGQAGLCMAVSADGLSWSRRGEGPFICSANDAASFVQVNPRAEAGPMPAAFLLYQQTWRYNPDLPQERDNLKSMHRQISIWTAMSFSPRVFSDGWVGPTTILSPDEKDPDDLQYYWMSAFHTDYGYGGLLNCHHTGSQVMDVRQIKSRDGWSWEFMNDREPLIPVGEAGRFDCGMVSAISPPVKSDGKTLIFYNGRSTVHDHTLKYPDQPEPDPSSGIGMCIFDSLF
ncbi:MAG: hypothetical protein HN368_11120 [Spirochaetales bacterium]|jgi:hypothetical protein|nr:hypothetical protein [Spirochaetales bacterium]